MKDLEKSQIGTVTGISFRSKESGIRGVLEEHVFEGGTISLISRSVKENIEKTRTPGFCMRRFKGDLETSGICYRDLKVGQLMKIGGMSMRITQTGKKCHAEDCPAFNGEIRCFMMVEVLFGDVEEPGKVAIGDRIEVLV